MLRPSSFTYGGENGFGLGEPELDANAALTELDKGLRSPRLGEQSEAIVRFPILFEKYPFPILINSAFLKLADVFRGSLKESSNFLRLWILRVCQQSERHHEKILNVDEFIRRIFSVIHSNDPIARALTLRTLGSLSSLISERKPIHHAIRIALDSHDRIEVSAAIYAASCFAKRSKTFSVTMCSKISSMVQQMTTPIDLKLQLIPIFQFMHHDVNTAAIVRKRCQELLLNYPSEEFVITILHTLTLLAASTISDQTEQISFLLQNLSDSRPLVKLNILKDLKLLGLKGAHLWEPSHISLLIDTIIAHYMEKMDSDEMSNLDIQIIHTTLDVIKSITTSSAILSFLNSPEAPIWLLLKTSINSLEKSISLKGIQISTLIIFNWKNDVKANPKLNIVELASSGIENLLKSLCSLAVETPAVHDEDMIYNMFNQCLYNGVLLCESNPEKCDWFCSVNIFLLKYGNVNAKVRNILCQTIGSIGNFNPIAVKNVLFDILNILESWKESQINEESTTVIVLIAVILQAHQGYSMSSRSFRLIQRIVHITNLWNAYRIARNSMRYGQPEITKMALEECHQAVASENYFFWLTGLKEIATAEVLLSDSKKIPDLQSRINQASNIYLQAVVSLGAASSHNLALQFQIEYVRLRSEMLVSFSNFLSSCNSFIFSPPPVIAQTIAATSRDELLKSGRVVIQLRKIIREFVSISEMYGRLYQTAFDADNDTLVNIQILQQVCLLVARAIEKVVVSKDHPTFSRDDQAFNFCIERNKEKEYSTSWVLIKSCTQVVNELKSLEKISSTVISHQHIKCLKEAVRIFVETPINYPRFFFQTLQNTRVKIAVSPQPRLNGECVTVTVGNNLALKVEGVIQQNGIKGPVKETQIFRKPKSIRLTVISTPPINAKAYSLDPNAKLNQEPVTVCKDVTPHRDFFTAQFLLGLWSGGITNVTVDTAIIDYENRVWMTGPRASVAVRVYDDSSSGKNISSIPSGLPAGVPGSSRPMMGPNSTQVARF